MKTGILDRQILECGNTNVSKETIRSLISEACLIQNENLSVDEIRSGDLYKLPQREYLINIRPDCDCIPRISGQTIDDVELYCLKGKIMREREILCGYRDGHFDEHIDESIVFALFEGKSIRFKFKRLIKQNYVELKEKRIGRLIHPYITRIQQRYALYLQRQGLPTIPEAAIEDNVD